MDRIKTVLIRLKTLSLDLLCCMPCQSTTNLSDFSIERSSDMNKSEDDVPPPNIYVSSLWNTMDVYIEVDGKLLVEDGKILIFKNTKLARDYKDVHFNDIQGFPSSRILNVFTKSTSFRDMMDPLSYTLYK